MTVRATTSQTNNSGQTTVTLSSNLTGALAALGVQTAGFGETQISNGNVVTFPIANGQANLNNNRVDILHNGGLTLKTGNTTVNLTDFEISNLNGSAVLTGLVTVNGSLIGRTALFNLQVGSVSTANQNGVTNLNLTNVATTLSPDAAAALNQAFGTTAFQSGFNIGTAQVNASVVTATGDVQGVSPPPIETEPSGATTVTLNSNLINTLTALGVQATGFGDTQISNGVANFEITGGAAQLNSNRVEIDHSGGLTFRRGNTTVTLSDFAISNLSNRAVLSGVVTVNGNPVTRTPLFDLQIGGVTTPATGRTNLTNLNLQNVALRLSPEAAAALNQAFGITSFQQGLSIGTANVNAFVNTATGDVEGTNPLRVVDVTGSNQSIFAGADNTTLNATGDRGGNRIYGGTGNDAFLLGANDRVFGGSGDDRFYVQTRGANRITGGEGADQFWIVNNGQAPGRVNTITDFQRGTDVIGLEGLVSSFNQLKLQQQGTDTLISANGKRLAILNNVRANRLRANDFNFATVGLNQNGEPDNLTNVVAKTVPTFADNARSTIEVTGRKQQVTGTQRNDLIDATGDRGNNRISGQGGGDTLIVGNGDRVFGDRGNDRFFAQSGGNNRLTGGLGADQFWIADGEVPTAVNTVTDFRSGRDVIGIAGLGVTNFNQLRLTQQGGDTLVSANGNNLALLQNVSAGLLTASNFTFA